MHDDPKHYRMIACGLIVACIVCLCTREEIPLFLMFITLAFFFWRWWVRREYWLFRKRKKPGTSLVLVERKGD